jgi:hypothetical protein
VRWREWRYANELVGLSASKVRRVREVHGAELGRLSLFLGLFSWSKIRLMSGSRGRAKGRRLCGRTTILICRGIVRTGAFEAGAAKNNLRRQKAKSEEGRDHLPVYWGLGEGTGTAHWSRGNQGRRCGPGAKYSFNDRATGGFSGGGRPLGL